MNLQEIFNDLSYGELSQVFIGTADGDGLVSEGDKPALISHIQMGLTALYKRFKLREGQVTVAIIEGTTEYTLNQPELLKIEEIQDEYGERIPLNERDNTLSIRTKTRNTLVIPYGLTAQYMVEDPLESITVIYRANHDVIDPEQGQYASESVEISLPVEFKEALLFFVASRVHSPIGMANEFHAGNSYYAKYESACQQLLQENLAIDEQAEGWKFEDRGFR